MIYYYYSETEARTASWLKDGLYIMEYNGQKHVVTGGSYSNDFNQYLPDAQLCFTSEGIIGSTENIENVFAEQ